MSGTKVLTGEGLFVILVVGDETCEGRIGSLLRNNEEDPTPLQKKLEAIARDIGKFGLYSGALIFIVLMIRFAIERIINNNFKGEHVITILESFMIGVVVIVVAIPEGLPLAVTISLAFSVKRMLKDQNLVRRL
jgi:magnesium-transporting ATPase (P-type)